MIRLASDEDEYVIREIWKICFNDTDEYIDLVFSNKYQASNTLLYFEGNKAVTALQMLPYRIMFYGAIVDFYYLAGLSTLPEYRGRGYMGQLIEKSHEVMRQRQIPLSILVPANESLFNYYRLFGYEQVSQRSNEPIYPLKNILDQTNDLESAYPLFVERYCTGNLHLQKSFDDFKLIVQEYINSNYENKYNLGAMAYMVDPELLIKLFRTANPHSTVPGSEQELCRLLFYGNREIQSQGITINFMLE